MPFRSATCHGTGHSLTAHGARIAALVSFQWSERFSPTDLQFGRKPIPLAKLIIGTGNQAYVL